MVNFFRNQIIWIVAVLIFLAGSWSLFRPGMFLVHDFVHAARMGQMLLALQDGDFPVRWTRDFGYGYGMPLFEFYAPLPYFIGAMALWVGLSPVLSVKLVMLIATLTTVIGSYLLGKRWFGTVGGLVTMALFTLAPYRAINLFIRGAISESWGMMALPWILYVGYEAIAQSDWSHRKKWWLLTVFWVSVLLLSHNLTAMMFLPLSGLVIVSWYLVTDWWQMPQCRVWDVVRQTLWLVGAYLSGLALSAFYYLPAIAEKNFTQIDSILTGYFHYSLHFLYLRQFLKPGWGFGGSTWGPDDTISFFFGFAQWFALGLCLMVVGGIVVRFLKQQKIRSLPLQRLTQLLILVGLTMLTGFLTLERSHSVWDLLAPLHFIQFPWRWLSVTTLGIALLGGWSLSLIKQPVRQLTAAFLIISISLSQGYYFRPERMMDVPSDYYYTDRAKIREKMSPVLPDYIPAALTTTHAVDSRLSQSDLESSQVEILVDSTSQFLVATSFDQERELVVNIASFPGWMVELDGNRTSPMEIEGKLAIRVPAGEHRVGFLLTRTQVRVVADFISLLTLLVLSFLILPEPRSTQKELNER